MRAMHGNGPSGLWLEGINPNGVRKRLVDLRERTCGLMCISETHATESVQKQLSRGAPEWDIHWGQSIDAEDSSRTTQ